MSPKNLLAHRVIVYRLLEGFLFCHGAFSMSMVGVGCGEDFPQKTSFGALPEDPERTVWASPPRGDRYAIAANKEGTCSATGGIWHANLLSCRCPFGGLYHVEHGCAWDLDAAWQAEVATTRLGGLEVHARDKHLNKQDIIKALFGWEVPEKPFSRAEHTIFIDPTKTWFQAVFGPILTSLFLGQKERWIALGSIDGVPLGEKTFAAECHELIERHTHHRDVFKELCTEMAIAVRKHINQDTPTRWFFQNESGLGFVGGAWTAHLAAGARTILANMEVSDGIIYSRRFLAFRSNGRSIRIEVGPDGLLIGGYIFELREMPEGSGFLTASKTTVFNQRLEVVDIRDTKSGSEDDFCKLADHLASPHLDRGTSGDNAMAPVGLIVAEHSVNPAAPTVVRMLDFRSKNISRPLMAPILGPLTDPLSHLAMFSEGSAAGHGTAVISAASRGLPGLKVNMIDLSALDAFRDPESFHRGAQSLLSDSVYRVFNISRSFPRLTNDCQSIFGPVIEQYKDQTLFVVAAESFGGANRADGCPQGLSRAHSNLVVVAPTIDGGDLDPESNYGGEEVDLAAPLRADAIMEVNKDVFPNAETWRPMSGSSASAALVSRLALKIFAARPYMTAPAVASMLCQHRQDKDLQVRCGGEIAFEKVEKIITSDERELP